MLAKSIAFGSVILNPQKMKTKILLVVLSIFLGFVLGRLTTTIPPSQLNLEVESGKSSEKSGPIAGREANPEVVSNKEYKAIKRHKTGDSFKIQDLIIKVSVPIVRYSRSGDRCITLPFEFQNVSEGRVYSPEMTSYNLRDNFGNECELFLLRSGQTSDYDPILGDELKDIAEDLKPGQIGIRYYDFEMPIDTATSYMLNGVWSISSNMSYWETERHIINYHREEFSDSKPSGE